jgi:short-subunit dehydrogenase involved in D-alanine esterification of teichoic acids
VQKVFEGIEAGGGSTMAIVANVAAENDVQRLIDAVVSHYETVDIMVNAGIIDNFVPAGEVADEL